MYLRGLQSPKTYRVREGSLPGRSDGRVPAGKKPVRVMGQKVRGNVNPCDCRRYSGLAFGWYEHVPILSGTVHKYRGMASGKDDFVSCRDRGIKEYFTNIQQLPEQQQQHQHEGGRRIGLNVAGGRTGSHSWTRAPSAWWSLPPTQPRSPSLREKTAWLDLSSARPPPTEDEALDRKICVANKLDTFRKVFTSEIPNKICDRLGQGTVESLQGKHATPRGHGKLTSRNAVCCF